MNKYTRDNPGCYHDLIRYLAEQENTDISKEEPISTLEALRKSKNIYYKASNVKVWKDGKQYMFPRKVARKGGIHVIEVGYNGTTFPIDTAWDKVTVTVPKSFNDFVTPVKDAGSYKDCLGGGWSQKVKLWSVGDYYFADMDCSCGNFIFHF
jgi:hypothetical protein